MTTDQPPDGRPAHREPKAHPAPQAFRYPLERPFVEPDWTRLPGFSDVTRDQWESAQWQRAHCVKNLGELAEALGPFLTDELREDIARDQRAILDLLREREAVESRLEHLEHLLHAALMSDGMDDADDALS